MKDFFDQDIPDSMDQSHDRKLPDVPREAEIGADEIACPVCSRAVGIPIPELCPNCQAPIKSIIAVLRVADLSIREAMRDLRVGDLDSVSRRLSLVRVTSKAHRLRAELIQAMLDRLKGEPEAALARLRAIRDQMKDMPEPDEELADSIAEIEASALDDQHALASCCEHYNFALFQAKRGHLEESRDAARRALGFVPHHAPSHLLLAKTNFALRENEDAKYHLGRALAVSPTDVSASRLLARMGHRAWPNPFEICFKAGPRLSRWIGPIFIVLVLIFIGLAALLGK